MFSSKSSSSSTTNYNDSSRNLSAETGALLASEGSYVNTGVGGDYVLNYDLGADVAGKSLDLAALIGNAMKALASDAVTNSNQTSQQAFAKANEMVENNAKLAGQSMDTALAFASNAKPVGATIIDTIPFIAFAAAAALVAYGVMRK
ncbi:RUS1 family protein [Termitidicoccus mucosus]|uniref:Uncharacterized protein n=1 Tax=Termitidicoccus mucosus TaxID=1184151 RepID=A0A178IKP2_9BACT|nr:hypothetical protein AW736_11140 [Opitutaceae bacterium TSB47]